MGRRVAIVWAGRCDRVPTDPRITGGAVGEGDGITGEK